MLLVIINGKPVFLFLYEWANEIIIRNITKKLNVVAKTSNKEVFL